MFSNPPASIYSGPDHLKFIFESRDLGNRTTRKIRIRQLISLITVKL